MFETLEEPEDTWLRDPVRIRLEIRRLAHGMLSYAAALNVSQKIRTAAGNVDVMPSSCHDKDAATLAQLFESRRAAEADRIRTALDPRVVSELVSEEFTRSSKLLE